MNTSTKLYSNVEILILQTYSGISNFSSQSKQSQTVQGLPCSGRNIVSVLLYSVYFVHLSRHFRRTETLVAVNKDMLDVHDFTPSRGRWGKLAFFFQFLNIFVIANAFRKSSRSFSSQIFWLSFSILILKSQVGSLS